MKRIATTLIAGLAACAARAQDPAAFGLPHLTVAAENDRVRVLHYRAAPGDRTPMHSHPDAVVYVVRGGRARFTAPDGSVSEATSETGDVLLRAPTSHADEALEPVESILVELKPRAQGTGGDAPGPQAAVAAHVARARDMLDAMFDPKRNFATDPELQQRHMTKALVAAVAERAAFAARRASEAPDERVDPPSSETFLDAWDRPSRYDIVGSRVYGDVAWVDVRFDWDEGTNYPGQSRLASYLLHRVGGTWRLADAYHHASAFATPGTLLGSLADRSE
ncbi:MAG TPA: hypothetical protein VFO79_13015 [Xanthomonadales bacterium]|nr:hypothetical protein [Xanthomonadales bacterium]